MHPKPKNKNPICSSLNPLLLTTISDINVIPKHKIPISNWENIKATVPFDDL